MHEPAREPIHREEQHPAATAGGFWTAAVALNIIMIGSTLQTPLYVIYQKQFGFSEIVLTLIYPQQS